MLRAMVLLLSPSLLSSHAMDAAQTTLDLEPGINGAISRLGNYRSQQLEDPALTPEAENMHTDKNPCPLKTGGPKLSERQPQ